MPIVFWEADLYKRRGRSSSSDSVREATRGRRRAACAGERRGERASHVHCAPRDRAARACRAHCARQHSQLSLPHDSHATGDFLSSLPRLKVEPSRFCSLSEFVRFVSSLDAGRSQDVSKRIVEFLTQGSRPPRPPILPRPAAVFKSTSLIFCQGLPRTEKASLLERSRAPKRRAIPTSELANVSSSATIEASGDDRSLRTKRGAPGVLTNSGERVGGFAGERSAAREGEGEALGRSDCERARGVCVRLAGVTSLRERKCIRLRTQVGESVSVTFILMLCAIEPFWSVDATSLLSVLLFSFKLCEFAEPLAFAEFLVGPARLGPAPAS